jgi:hypothetical protein
VRQDRWGRVAEEPWFPPASDVEACRADAALQAEHPPEDGWATYLRCAGPCPLCARPAAELEWFWFQSPESTWAMFAGSAGWMTFCTRDAGPVDYFVRTRS